MGFDVLFEMKSYMQLAVMKEIECHILIGRSYSSACLVKVIELVLLFVCQAGPRQILRSTHLEMALI